MLHRDRHTSVTSDLLSPQSGAVIRSNGVLSGNAMLISAFRCLFAGRSYGEGACYEAASRIIMEQGAPQLDAVILERAAIFGVVQLLVRQIDEAKCRPIDWRPVNCHCASMDEAKLLAALKYSLDHHDRAASAALHGIVSECEIDAILGSLNLLGQALTNAGFEVDLDPVYAQPASSCVVQSRCVSRYQQRRKG